MAEDAVANHPSEIADAMTIYKTPFEQFAVSVDFTAELGPGNTISSIAAVTALSNLTGLNSTAEVVAATPVPSISTSGTAVSFEVCGGVIGETHTVSVQIVSSIAEKHQRDAALRIVE